MERFLGRYEPHLYAILRIVAGLSFATHGTQKLFGWPGDKPPATAPLAMTAGVIELVGGLMIALGVFASFAAFIASGTMAVAYFKSHGPAQWWPLDDTFFPVVNRGELAMIYCFLFLYIAARGATWPWRRTAPHAAPAEPPSPASGRG